MFFVLLIIGASSQTTGGNNITVCDCGSAEVIGLMDNTLPSYCDDNITSAQSVMEAYDFYVTEGPHTVWSADLCMKWRKTRTTSGYFFGSFDTIDTMTTTVTTADECKQLVKSHVCDGNKMTELTENAYEFKGNPTQKGTWMQEVIETKKNCATKVDIHKNCLYFWTQKLPLFLGKKQTLKLPLFLDTKMASIFGHKNGLYFWTQK
jgi:hypothetical protein